MGGAEVHLHEIFRRIVKMGHKVTLIAHKFPGGENEEIIDGIKILRFGNKYLFNNQFKRFYNKNLIGNNYDLIVDDISKIPLNIPSYADTPIVGILHHIHGSSLYKEIPFPLAYYIIQKERSIPKYYRNTPIFVVSDSTKMELVNLGFDRNITGLLYNAIDENIFKGSGIKKSETPLITYVGRIKKYKNIEKLIEAVSILKNGIPEIKLIIGGKGDNISNLQEYVKTNGLSKYVEFTGFLTEEEKAELLARAWIFVTMAEKEGWGITVIEANAAGTPAIGSDVPGLRDSIKNGETGYLVPLNDSVKLAETIANLVHNREKLKEMSSNAVKWSKNFSWDKSAEYFLTKVIEWYPSLNSKID